MANHTSNSTYALHNTGSSEVEHSASMGITINISYPLLGVGGAVTVLCLLFCCYLFRLKRQGTIESGIKRVTFGARKKKVINETCAVCLEDFENNEKVSMCSCSHAFHARCLNTWLEQKNTCPMCKTPVKPGYSERTSLVTPLFSRNLPSTHVTFI